MKQELGGLKIDPDKKRPPRPGAVRKWLLRALGVIGILALVAAALHLMKAREENPAAAIPATSSPPAAADRSAEILVVSGYVVAHHKIEVGSKVMGKVAWIGVEKGDKVRKGQLLVRLDDREFRAQLAQAEALQRAAEFRLAELRAGFRSQEIQRAEAELMRLKADLNHARVELTRLEALLGKGATSPQQVDAARSRLEMAEASVRMADRNYELYKLGPRPEQVSSAQAELDHAKANVVYARTILDATEIRAPIGGTILERLVETGEMVTTSFAGELGAKSAVVSLADLNDLQVELDISQTDFNRISQDQECLMTPEAYPERTYRCEIAEISPEANRQKATIQIKVQIMEPDPFLRPEMNARVTFSRKMPSESAAADGGASGSKTRR